jgi:hypothetical protein
MGAFVQGAPRPAFRDYDNSPPRGGGFSGFGGAASSGFGNYSDDYSSPSKTYDDDNDFDEPEPETQAEYGLDDDTFVIESNDAADEADTKPPSDEK